MSNENLNCRAEMLLLSPRCYSADEFYDTHCVVVLGGSQNLFLRSHMIVLKLTQKWSHLWPFDNGSYLLLALQQVKKCHADKRMLTVFRELLMKSMDSGIQNTTSGFIYTKWKDDIHRTQYIWRKGTGVYKELTVNISFTTLSVNQISYNHSHKQQPPVPGNYPICGHVWRSCLLVNSRHEWKTLTWDVGSRRTGKIHLQSIFKLGRVTEATSSSATVYLQTHTHRTGTWRSV